MSAVLALDIGGTKLASAIVDGDGRLHERREVPTPASTDAEVVWAALAGLLEGRAGVAAIGIASAGPLDIAAGTVSPVNIGAWRGFPLIDRVRRRLPALPTTLLGDAAAAAVGELALGAGRDARSGLFAVVSTGIGGGLFLDRRVLRGPHGNAGHLGHTIVELDGEPCACGARGCVEAYASGPSMVGRAVAAGWRPPVPPTTPALMDAARAGDPVARDAVERGGRALAAMIASQAAALEIDIAILGGGVMAAADVLLPAIERGLARYARLPFLQNIELRPAALGRDAGLVGAGLVAHDQQWLVS